MVVEQTDWQAMAGRLDRIERENRWFRRGPWGSWERRRRC